MVLKDYHIHTTYDDGKSTPREIVEKAIEMGLVEIGFSVHSYDFYSFSGFMTMEKVENFKKEIYALKEEYKDKISILCGIEEDFFSTTSTNGFEYIIGAVHHVKVDKKYISISGASKERVIDSVKKYFNGDFYSLCENYYDTISNLIEKTKADIIAHFDLVTKYNENDCLFDTKNARYINAWKNAVDKLLKYNVPFEINTGAISRGYRTETYPSQEIIDYIKKNGGKLLINSDSHHKDTICFAFDKFEFLLDK